MLAAPIYFMGISPAQMKAMIDRCQALWVRKYVLKIPPLGDRRERKGFFISVGGRKVANVFDGARFIVESFFIVIDLTYAGELLFRNIDAKDDIAKHSDALQQACLVGQKLVED